MTASVARTTTLALLVAALALIAPVSALAGGSPPVSAIAQYVEQIPTSEGSSAVGTGKPKRGALTPTAHEAIDNAAPGTATALTEVATSSSYGAPISPLLRVDGDKVFVDEPTPSFSDSLGAAAEAVGGGSGERLLLLILVLLGTTAAALAAALRGRT